MSYVSEAELAEKIRANLPKGGAPTSMQSLARDSGFLLLTSVIGREGTPALIMPAHITALTPTSDGTTLYMAGGKHITVRETPTKVMEALVAYRKWMEYGRNSDDQS